MDQLPTEILRLVLRWEVSMSRDDKNSLLPLRLVCKAFDEALKPYLLKTVKLEYSCFLRDATLSAKTLKPVGNLVDSVYMDMMVIRDEGMLYQVLLCVCLRLIKVKPYLKPFVIVHAIKIMAGWLLNPRSMPYSD